MNIPKDLQYARSHEWFRAADGAVGLTDHAQEGMGDLVFIELPQVGDKLKKGDSFAVVESVKATSDVYLPVDGTVSAVNDTLTDEPELVNSDCYNAWLVKLDGAQADGLMNAEEYEAYLVSEEA